MQKATRHTGFVYYRRIVFTYVLVLLVPIILIGIVNYIFMRAQLLGDLKESINFEAQRQLSFLQQQMKTINTVVYESRHSKMYSRYYMKDYPNTSLDLMRDIRAKEAMMPFCESIYFYDNIEQIAFGANGKYDKSFFISNVVSTKKPSSVAELADSENTVAVKIKHEKTGKDGVALIAPVSSEPNSNGQASTFLVLVISDDIIAEQLGKTELNNNGQWLLSFGKNTIYCSDNANNKLLFNDDKEQINLDEKSSYIYSFANDTLFSIIWTVSKQIFVLKILSFVGFQSLILLAILGIGLLIIYYFSRKTYSPIKKLVDNVGQYQLNSTSGADELDYVNLALNDLLRSRDVLQSCNQDLKLERILYELLGRDTQSDDKFYLYCISEGIALNRQSLFFVVFDDNIQNQCAYAFFEEEIKTLSSITDVYSLYLMENRFVYLVCSDEETTVIDEWINSLEKQNAVLGKGNNVSGISDLRSSYLCAKSELNATECLIDDIVYPFNELNSLQISVENETPERAAFLIKDMLCEFNGQENLKALISWDILQILSSKQQLADYIAGSNNELDCTRLGVCIEESYDAFAKSCSTLVDTGYRKKNIAEIISFIDCNFADCNFSIKTMAADFGTTASNLSHFFKKSTGQNISAYIVLKKMEKAKEMLLKGNYKVNEISSALGYSNPAMFIEQFKKYEGTTPGNFKAHK